MTHDETAQLIREAARQAAQEVIAAERIALGEDGAVLKTISTILTSFGLEDDDRRELRADLLYLRKWRKSMESMQRVSTRAAFGFIATAIFAAIALGFKTFIADWIIHKP